MTDKTIPEQIAELTNQVKELGGLKEADRDAIYAKMQSLLDAQREQILDQIPQRAGEPAAPEVQREAEAYKGKWGYEAKQIAKHGSVRIGGSEVKAVDFFMAKQLLDSAARMAGAGELRTNGKDVKPASAELTAVTKLLTSTGSGTGDELVPTNMAAEIWQDFFTASQIAADLGMMPMPSDPFDISMLGEVTWRKGGQGAATTSSNPATAKSTLTSTEQVAEVDWSYSLDEDSVVALMPELRRNIARSGGEQMDAFTLNADSTATASSNINLIDGTPAADAYYLSDGQDGIRHQWIIDNSSQANTGSGSALSDAVMSGALNDLGKYGLDLNNVRIVPGVESYFSMVGLTNVATVDKYGPNATIVKGELARYRGIPVLPSASMLKANNAGKQAVAAGTLGAISIYNRNQWKVGFRRGLMIEVDRDIRTRQLIMVVSFRIAVGCYGTRSTATHTSGVYNFSL